MDNLVDLEKMARECTRKDWRNDLKQAHTDLIAAVNTFYRRPTKDKLTHLVGLWTYAHRLYDSCPPNADPEPPMSGAPEAARLAA